MNEISSDVMKFVAVAITLTPLHALTTINYD